MTSIKSNLIQKEYTITKDQFVFLPPTFVFMYYGCPPEYGFEPAEGQSVEDWMNEFAISIIDGVEKLDIYFDGTKIEEIENYRLNTGVFTFTANPDLTECYDPCYTGMPQPGLVDGYFTVFKKMKKGKHTILVRGALPAFDLAYDITINLNVI